MYGQPPGLADLIDRYDGRMSQPGGASRLAEQAAGAVGPRQDVGSWNLERDLAPERRIPGGPHLDEPASAEERSQRIAANGGRGTDRLTGNRARAQSHTFVGLRGPSGRRNAPGLLGWIREMGRRAVAGCAFLAPGLSAGP